MKGVLKNGNQSRKFRRICLSYGRICKYHKKFRKNSENSHNLTFGQAIEALKSGKRVSRKGWNSKGMFLFIMKGSLSGTEVHKQHEYLDEKIEIQDCICMKTVQNTVCVGWLASQADMLAEDWEIVE